MAEKIPSPKYRFAPARTVFSAIGSAILMAVLDGCGVANEEATSAPAPSESKPSKTPMADLSDTQNPMNGNGEVAADSTSTATTNGQEIDGETTLPGIDDTCAGCSSR